MGRFLEARSKEASRLAELDPISFTTNNLEIKSKSRVVLS